MGINIVNKNIVNKDIVNKNIVNKNIVLHVLIIYGKNVYNRYILCIFIKNKKGYDFNEDNFTRISSKDVKRHLTRQSR